MAPVQCESKAAVLQLAHGVEKLLLPRIALPLWAGQGGPQRF
jgi:hypothetical protein